MDYTSRRSSATSKPSASTGNTGGTVPKSLSDLPQDDEHAAKLVLSTKTHYEALFIHKTSSESEIKLSYRKLALRFHPDRCSAPSAESAFKLISSAYSVLMDSTKRQTYDMQMAGGFTSAGGGTTRGGFGNSTFQFHTSGEDMTAEDLFNMFFFNGAGSGAARRQQQQQQNARQRYQRANNNNNNNDENWQQFLYFLPLLVMLFFTLLSMIPSQDPPVYSMERYGRYSVPYTTPNLDVVFYVTTDTHQTLQRDQPLRGTNRERINITKMFDTIEDEHVQGLEEACHKAMTRRLNAKGEICDKWRTQANLLGKKRKEAKEKK